jgi:hypothetical protein
MSRPAPAAAEARPAENELLTKLDKSLRERAQKLVDAALEPAINKACGVIEDAMYQGLGNAIGPAIRRDVGVTAASSIRQRAIELTYRKLVDQTLELLAGNPVVVSGGEG